MFDGAGGVPDAQLGEIAIERFFGDGAARVGERLLRRRNIDRRRFLRAVQLEGLVVLGLRRLELLARESESRLRGAEIGERTADVFARGERRLAERDLRLFLAMLRSGHAREHFAVDLAICPEQILTDYIVKLVEFPEALQVLDFADGKVSLVAVRAYQGGPMVGRPVKEIRAHMPGIDTRVVAIFRHDRAILPEGHTVIEAGDEVFCLAAAANISKVMHELRRMDQPVKRVMIAGGGNIGQRLSQALAADYSVRVIDHNKRRCELLAATLEGVLVLNGDATASP